MLRSVFLAGFLLAGVATVTPFAAAEDLPPGEQVRRALIDLLEIARVAQEMGGAGKPTALVEFLSPEIAALDSEILARWERNLPAMDASADRIASARALIDFEAAKVIEFPTPDTEPPECAAVTPGIGVGLLTAWGSAREIQAASKWICKQTDAGFNTALACNVVNAETQLLLGEYQAAKFCLKAQREGVFRATLETQDNIADFLNENVDASVDSRASAESVAAIAADLAALQTTLEDLDTTLESDFLAIDQSLDAVEADIGTLATTTSALGATQDDVQFRSEAIQADVEDAQRRAAAVEESLEASLANAQALVTSFVALSASSSELRQRVTTSGNAKERIALTAALSDPGQRILRYALPENAGGELEASREIVIDALLKVSALGRSTLEAQDALGRGDNAYNQGLYLIAYGHFAAAYQALISPSDLVIHDSFET